MYGKQRDATLASLTQRRTSTLSDYGYDQNLAFDPNNPFSRAALLKRHYDQSRTGDVNNYASRGQLYAGSLQNQLNERNFGQQQGEDSLQKQLIKFLANNAEQTNKAGTDYELNVMNAGAAKLDRATR